MAPGPLWDVPPDQQGSEVWVALEVASADVALSAVALSWPQLGERPSAFMPALPVHGSAGVWLCLPGCSSVGVQLCLPAVPAAGCGPPSPAVRGQGAARNPQALS